MSRCATCSKEYQHHVLPAGNRCHEHYSALAPVATLPEDGGTSSTRSRCRVFGKPRKDGEPEAKSEKPKKAKKAKQAKGTLAGAESSGSQSAAENEDSNGGEELGGEPGEALKERAGLSQTGKEDGMQAEKQTKEKKMEAILAHVRTDAPMEAILTYVRLRCVELDAKTTEAGKSAKEELSGEEERFRKGGRGRGRGKAEKVEKE
jgi:hypothetical protein